MNGNKLKFTAKENPSSEEIEELRTGLRSYNDQFNEGYPRKKIIHQVRNEEEKLVGGIYGEVSWGWLYIELLWVDDSVRGSGLGSKLIKNIELSADNYNVSGYYLSTTTFQARNFYEKMGYEVCGEIEGFPPGHSNYFMKKTRNR